MKRVLLFIAAALMVFCCTNTPKTVESDATEINLENLAPALDYNTVDKQEMLDLLLKYLAVESGSKYPAPGDTTYPMTPGQIEMAKLLESDARTLGVQVVRTPWQYVYVDIPSNLDHEVPVLGISCHLDYSPEAPGKNIKPTVIEYKGGDIQLADGSVISPDAPDGKDLPGLVGKTIIHSDGRSLLGGDDKNGCAIVMSLIKTVIQPGVKHGRIQVAFCPNEDIGMADERIDTTFFKPDVLFDVDGAGGNEATTSNFTARGFMVTFKGRDAHASEAKAQKFGDALAAAATYIAYVPIKYRPENTEGKQGYIHHYMMIPPEDGGVDYTVDSRIRYFDQNEGELFDKILKESLAKVSEDFPNVGYEIVKDCIQYDNVAYSMYEGSHNIIGRAAARSGQTLDFKAARGGTTAAMFTTRGLRGGMCIYSGQHNDHKVHEYSCLEEMMSAYELLLYAVDEVAQIKD